MQVEVQKSTRTTFPRRPATVSGGELSHPVAPPKEGSSPSTGSRTEAVCSPAGTGQCAVMTMPPLWLDVPANGPRPVSPHVPVDGRCIGSAVLGWRPGHLRPLRRLRQPLLRTALCRHHRLGPWVAHLMPLLSVLISAADLPASGHSLPFSAVPAGCGVRTCRSRSLLSFPFRLASRSARACLFECSALACSDAYFSIMTSRRVPRAARRAQRPVRRGRGRRELATTGSNSAEAHR